MGFFDKIKAGLAKTRAALSDTLDEVFSGFATIDDDFYDELEETLILADLGVDTASKVIEELRRRAMNRGWSHPDHVKFGLKQLLTEMLNVGDTALDLSTKPSGPFLFDITESYFVSFYLSKCFCNALSHCAGTNNTYFHF